MEDSGYAFDEELRVGTQADWVAQLFGPRSPTRRVRVSRRDLWIEGLGSIPRNQITTAFMSAENDHFRVVVGARSVSRMTIHVESREKAERFLRALTFSTTEKNAVFRLLPTLHLSGAAVFMLLWMLGICLMIGSVAFSIPVVVALVAVVVAAVALAMIRSFTRQLTVGLDGISVSEFWRTRFISYADIVSIRRYAEATGRRQNQTTYSGLAIHLRRNIFLSLRTTFGRGHDDQLIGAYERISEALTEWRAARPIDDLAIDRGGRSTEEWISSLRQLGKSEATTYRAATVDRDALFAIIEDPANQAVSRVAAAVAISGRLDDEARARLLKSAEVIADPKLRVAMENVAHEKDDDIAATLDDLDPIEKVER